MFLGASKSSRQASLARRLLQHRRAGGFSLVEVTLALGLVSFALVSTLGLLPTGLSTLRSSMNQTVEAQILQSIANRSIIASYGNVDTNTLYYDDEGLPVDRADKAYYIANISPQAVSFPGSSNAVSLTNSLKTVRVAVVARPFPNGPGRTNTFSLQLANSGK